MRWRDVEVGWKFFDGLVREFRREFPEINVTTVVGRGNELTTRIMSERRAGRWAQHTDGRAAWHGQIHAGQPLARRVAAHDG